MEIFEMTENDLTELLADCRVDVYGGDSHVLVITHLPSGLSVSKSITKPRFSQLHARREALENLYNLLKEKRNAG